MSATQKNNLNSHLEFINAMLKKTEKTEFEAKWKQLKELINSTERISVDKISLIEATLSSLKEKLKCYEATPNEPTIIKPIEPVPPLPPSSNKIQKKKIQKINNSTIKDSLRSPLKLSITKKYAAMASPRRENPKLVIKLNLNEIRKRKKELKRKRRNKKIKLLFVTRGQSVKKEIMTPIHNTFEKVIPEIAQVVVTKPPAQNCHTETPAKRSEPDLIKVHGIKDCEIRLERLEDTTKRTKDKIEPPQVNPGINGLEPPKKKIRVPKRKSAVHNVPTRNKKVAEKPTVEPTITKPQEGVPESTGKVTRPKQENNSILFSNVSTSPPAMVAIPNDILIPSLHNHQKILLSPDLTMKKLRPWLKASDHQKQLYCCDEMLTNDLCLAALFKCMASQCCYFTNNQKDFTKHMRLHWILPKEHDVKNFCKCPYCDFKNENSYLDVINHVIEQHGCCRYQCNYCFYRSYDYHIVVHMRSFHPEMKPEKTIKLNKPMVILKAEKEVQDVWKNFFSTCRKMACVVCKEMFLSITHFERHFNAHEIIPDMQCKNCKLMITKETVMSHLKGCHGFGNYNCAFCKFGTDSIEVLKSHLANEHANKFLFFFDRSYQSESKDEVSKQFCLKQFTLQLSKRWVVKNFPRVQLENAKNVRKNLDEFPAIKTEAIETNE